MKYSQQTKDLHGALLIACLAGDLHEREAALVQLAKSVHCDLTGELRGPHGLGPPQPGIGDRGFVR
jgi:hypothetical protein